MKKGFTLIELLAVIVILAIVALIATPIVLNIIDDARQSSTLRSADFYLDSLEYSIADATLHEGGVPNGTYSIMEDGSLCIGTLSNKECTGTKLEVEVNGEVPKSGTIEIENGNIKDIKVDLNNKTVVKSETEELTYYISPCKVVSGNKDTNGSKYECEVKPGTTYSFYVLSQESDGTTNLIMDRNICEDGTLATETNKCLVAWLSKDDHGTLIPYDGKLCRDEGGCVFNAKGPVTAMKYLYNATKTWTNIPVLNYSYNDKEFQGPTSSDFYTYTSFISSNGIATIIALDGTTTATIGSQIEPLRARMPVCAYDETKS